MRAAVRSVLAMTMTIGTAIAGPVGVSPAAVNQVQNPAIASVLPAGDAVVGVAHPVVVTFSAAVTDRRTAEHAVDVRPTSPAMTGRFEWLDDNVVQWVPDRFWPAHSRVTLSVGGRPVGFKTGPAVVGVADISAHTFTVTIDGVGADTPSRRPTPHHRPHWGEEGVLPASMGKPDFPTPAGSYAVIAKEGTVTMDSSSVGIPVDDPEGYHLSVDHSVRITRRGLFVHSAPWAENVLGIENTSHGCIGLSPVDAQWYFDTVNIGDPVIVQE